eukprot:113894_1
MDDGPQLLGEAVSGERVSSRGTMLGAGLSATANENNKSTIEEKEKLERENYEKYSTIARMQNERLSKYADKEIKNLRKNRLKILNKWRSYQREIKYEELTTQIDIICSTHYREIDHQVYKLKNVNNDIDKLNDQFLSTEKSQFRKMGQLNNIHKGKMIELQSEFERDLEILKKEFNSEKEYILNYHKQQKQITESVINEIDKRELNEMHETKQIHETEREELRNKNLEDLNVLKIQLEAETEEYEKQFDETHDRYIESTEDKNHEFEELKQKDEKLSLEIENLMKRIEILQQQLTFWKRKISSNDKECTHKITTLKKNKIQLMQQYRSLKLKMSKFRKTQKDRLSNIVTSARKTNQINSDVLSMGERILKYAEIASKLETEKEKVIPFGDYDKVEEVIDIDNDDTNESLHNLRYFIQKYNIALMDTSCFEQKRKALLGENHKLRAILKAYLQGITVAENTVNEANTLFVVNNNTQFINKSEVNKYNTQKNKCVVEGNHVINAYTTQLNTAHINVA